MWTRLNQQLIALENGTQPPLTLAQWAATVPLLISIRHQLTGPTAGHDPFRILATATHAATTHHGPRRPAAATHPMTDILSTAAVWLRQQPSDPRTVASHNAALTNLTYQLLHHTRAHTSDPVAAQWLHVAEQALDNTLPRPAQDASFTGALTAWHTALAHVQTTRDTQPVRRGMITGHLTLLRIAHRLVRTATDHKMLPTQYAQQTLHAIRNLGLSHQRHLQVTTTPTHDPRLEPAMIQLGRAVRSLLNHTSPTDAHHTHIAALLRTTIGHAPLVAALTGNPTAMAAAHTLEGLTTQYLANPDLLQPAPQPEPPAHAARTTPPGHRHQPAPTSTLQPGERLDPATVRHLCSLRDLGTLAATADPDHPPTALRTTPTDQWPALIEQGHQAVADLITSVIPMAYAGATGTPQAEDRRADMLLAITQAAHTYNPHHHSSSTWANYAWSIVTYGQRGFRDTAGIAYRPDRNPERLLTQLPIDHAEQHTWDPVQPDPTSHLDITTLLDQLPVDLQHTVRLTAHGHTHAEIGDHFDVSEATIRRRLTASREQLQPHLHPTPPVPDPPVSTNQPPEPSPMRTSAHQPAPPTR